MFRLTSGLILAALFFVQDVQATSVSSVTFAAEGYHETAGKDSISISATLTTALAVNTAETVTLVLGSTTQFAIGGADSSLTHDTDYTLACGSTEFPSSAIASAAYTHSSTQLVITMATTNAGCAINTVLKLVLKTVTYSAGTITTTAATLKTSKDQTPGSAAAVTLNRGSFSTITASSLSVSSFKTVSNAAFSLKFTGSTLGINAKFTVSVPGYSLAGGSQCTLTATTGTNPTVAVTGSTADVSPWEFTLLTQAMTAQEYTFACDKVNSPTAEQAASTVAAIIGDTTQTVTMTGLYALPAVANSSSPTTAPTTAPSCAGGTAFSPPACGSSSTLSVGLLSLSGVVFSLFL